VAAAEAAARRGAVHEAAELAEHAPRLTPRSPAGYAGRPLMFAQRLTEVGELSRISELLVSRVGELPADSVRARAYLLLGEAAGIAAHEDYLERGLAESGDDPMLRSRALATKSMLLALSRVARIGKAEALAVQAHRLARPAGAEVRRHAQQALRWAQIMGGKPAGGLNEDLPGSAGNSSLYESSIDRPGGAAGVLWSPRWGAGDPAAAAGAGRRAW
jgi:hypothetical protein